MFYRKIYVYFAATLCLLGDVAMAAERNKVSLPQTRALSWECMSTAAQSFDLPLAALAGILAAEGGREGEALSNRNGTWDLGPFQLNTCHVNELYRLGLSPEVLLQDGCANAFAAAWVLHKEYRRSGNIWHAIGAYHSRKPALRDAYIVRVKNHLARMKAENTSTLPELLQ